MISIKQVKDQSKLCSTLMNKLDTDINNAELTYDGVKNYTRIREDIRRIRRELMDLSGMLSKYV